MTSSSPATFGHSLRPHLDLKFAVSWMFDDVSLSYYIQRVRHGRDVGGRRPKRLDDPKLCHKKLGIAFGSTLTDSTTASRMLLETLVNDVG